MGGVKLVLFVQTSPLSEMMRHYKCFLHVSKMPTLTDNRANSKMPTLTDHRANSKMPTLTDNRANSAIIKNVIILNIIHNILISRGTDVAIYILLVLLKTADDLNHNSETIVNIEPKSYCQHYLWSYVRN